MEQETNDIKITSYGKKIKVFFKKNSVDMEEALLI